MKSRLHSTISVTQKIDKMFEDTNIEIIQQDTNEDKALERFEFLEICIRMAFARFKTDESVSAPNAFHQLMSELLIPKVWLPAMDSDRFRSDTLYKRNVVDILESEHVQPYKFTGVHIYKLNWLNKEKEITNG